MRSSLLLAAALAATALAGCGGGSSTPVAPSAAPAAVGVSSVDLTRTWSDAGVAVAAGGRLRVTASGAMHWQATCGATCTATPAGAACDAAGFPAPTLPCWSLIGRIGADGTPFAIGASYDATVPYGGELYLGVNDDYTPDNTGNWAVSISTS